MGRYLEIMQGMAYAVAKASVKIAEDFRLVSTSALVMDKVQKDGLPDFVTNTDIEAQRIIGELCARHFPGIKFLGEEGEKQAELPEAYFLVDPLDGTSNFVALRDYFSCSAAYVENGEVKAAVISDPMRGILVKAYKDGGCFRSTIEEPLDGAAVERLKNENISLKQVQLECELAMNSENDFALLRALVPSMSGMRKSGSTALDILNLVLGRRIALVSKGLESHDVAAGLLIAREAGGVITSFTGEQATIDSRDILAGSPTIHRQVILFANNL